MRCERAQELFSEYCEGTVQRALKVPLESHLGACGQCRDEVSGLRRVWKLLDDAPLMSPPEGFRAAVWQRIDAQQAARNTRPRFSFDWRSFFTRPALAWGAAIVLLVLFSRFVVPGSYSPAGIGRLGHTAESQFVAARPQIQRDRDVVSIRIPIFLADADGKVALSSSPIHIRLRVLGGS